MPASRVFLRDVLEAEGLRERNAQKRVSETVSEAIRREELALIEAPPGAGKTLAYLVPALLSRKRVVISTATRGLQTQILEQEIPMAERLLANVGGTQGARAVELRGISNYVCKTRLAEFEKREAGDEAWRISKWAHQTSTGERSEIEVSDRMWEGIQSRADLRKGEACPHYESCFVTKARKRAALADVLVVNHALYAADRLLRDRGLAGVLPEHDIAIFDEAHRLESSLSSMGRTLSQADFTSISERIRAAGTMDEVSTMERLFAELAESFESFRQGSHRGAYENNEAREPLRMGLERWLAYFERLRKGTFARDNRLASLETRMKEMLERFEEVRIARGEERAFHLPHADASHTFASIREDVKTVVLIGATLAETGDEPFRALKKRLRVQGSKPIELRIDAAQETRAIGFVDGSLPEPDTEGYEAARNESVLVLVEWMKGGAFVLSTSHEASQSLALYLREKTRLMVLEQSDGTVPELLRKFREEGNAVLVGTMSFWQGVDVPGDALRLVILTRLPFFLHETDKPDFKTDLLPKAQAWVRQAFGRLLRHENDRGIFAVLDKRVLSRSYGASILSSVPVRFVESLEEAKKWWEIGMDTAISPGGPHEEERLAREA